MKPSAIKADIELQTLLRDKVFVVDGDGVQSAVVVYTNGERSGINVPENFIDVLYTGEIRVVDRPMDLVKGYLIVSLYVKLNPDSTIKKNRVEKILSQFDTLINRVSSERYYYEYVSSNFITPTSAYSSIGYSVTELSVRWHTK